MDFDDLRGGLASGGREVASTLGGVSRLVGRNAIPIARHILNEIPVSVVAGQEGLQAAQAYRAQRQQYAANQDLMQRQQALRQQLANVDPSTPEGLRQAVRTMYALGFPGMAMGLLEMAQRGELAQYAAQQRFALAAYKQQLKKQTPEWGDVQKMGDSYGKRGGAAFEEVANAYNRIDQAFELYQTGSDVEKAQAYQIMNVALQKILDPGSVVRESEFARTEQFRDLLGRAEDFLEKLKTGAVSPDLIEGIYRASTSLYRRAAERQTKDWDEYTERAQRFGFDPSDVLAGFENPHSGLAEASRKSKPPSPSRPSPSRPTKPAPSSVEEEVEALERELLGR